MDLLRRFRNRWLNSPVYRAMFRRQVTTTVDAVAGVALDGQSDDYRSYLKEQIERSLWVVRKVKDGPPLPRTRHLVSLMQQPLSERNRPHRVLCVGCRNTREINHIESVCGAHVTGLDLFSTDPRITVGDMHKMPFPADTFDCVYSCHNLEHAYNVRVALAEFVRVLRPGGILTIEVPIRFELGPSSDADRHDFRSVSHLVELLRDHLGEVVIAEDAERQVEGQTRYDARLVAKIRK